MNRRTAIRLFAATAGAAAAAVVARQAQRRARLLRTQGKNVRDEFVAKYPVERSFVTVAGCRTHVYMAGPKESDRRPLLLLHGGVIEAASWMEAVTALCADRLVIAPDLPAHGASGYLPPPQLLGWLEAFVNHSDLHNFDLGGHSMGGGLAIRYAAQHGDRVRRLILCAPVGMGLVFPRVWPEPWNTGLLPFPLSDSLIEKVWGDHHRLTPTQRWQFDLIFSDFFLSRRWWWYISGGWQWLLDLPASVLESITSPTLLVWGEKDRIVPFNGARTAHFIDHLPHARVHFFPSLGHLPQVESPDEFNAVIRDFLAD